MAAEMTAVEQLRVLAFPSHEEEIVSPEAREEILRENWVGRLEKDLEGRHRVDALSGLCGLLGGDARVAVAQVLDVISWKVLGLVLGCLEQSAPSGSSGAGGGAGSRPPSASKHGGQRGRLAKASKAVVLCERLVLDMAEIFSPKELHIMALEHLHAYSGERTLRAVLAVLRRSTERMPPLQRAKFLEAAMQPALEATKRVAQRPASPQASRRRNSNSDSDGHIIAGGGEGSRVQPRAGDMHPPVAEGGVPSRKETEAAAAAAEAAIGFVGPLLQQACAERGQANGAAVRTAEGSDASKIKSAKVEAAAFDRSLAAYLGFALSALEAAAETSVCAAAIAASAAATDLTTAAAASCSEPDGSVLAHPLARAEERLAELVLDAPAVDLQFILLHGYRLSFADRVKRRSGEGLQEHERSASSGDSRGPAVLGELAVTGAMPWPLDGVSCLAYLVASEAKLRDKWLPLVWSRRTERRLFLPHAESLMRAGSNGVASKGLELACFVAERLGRFPDEAGAFAFEWEPENGAVACEKHVADDTGGQGSGRSLVASDPFRFDIVGFLQVLLDVMVSCPLPALRARGHAAMSAFLTSAGETSRFHLLKRLIDRCPWTNAKGLLLDSFRREIDRALRRNSGKVPFSLGVGDAVDSGTAGRHKADSVSPGDTIRGVEGGGAAAGRVADGSWRETVTFMESPFASAAAGNFVCEQLRRACRKGPPASLLMDMDVRTGGFALARYALALDVGGDGGWLKLRQPDRLKENRLRVKSFLDELRRAAPSPASAGPEHFRLFILEDAAQQCLQELER